MADQKILIKFPTRQRREKFFKVLNQYIRQATRPDLLEFVIICDEDDPEMNNKEVRKKLKSIPNLTFVFGDSKTKVMAVNAVHPEIDFDIIVVASDDMIPAAGYDEVIRDKMDEHFPDSDGVLFFNDGYQGNKLNTLPIMGKKYYSRFDYIYYPGYVTWYCDNEFMEIANILGRQVFIDEVIIKHEHPDNIGSEYDDLNRKNNVHHGDKELFRLRKEKNFFLKTMLIIQPGRSGDIIINLPIAKYFSEYYLVKWQCPKKYHDIFENIDYCKPVESKAGNYDKVLDLSFGFGGPPEAWWQQNKKLFDSFVRAKYHLAGVDILNRWKLSWERNENKENELYDHIVEKYGEDYILVHETTHKGTYVTIDKGNKVEFAPIEGYNIFDWYKVIENAKEIHCIDSLLSNFIEAVPEFFDLKKTIYLTAREPNQYLRSIYVNGWKRV